MLTAAANHCDFYQQDNLCRLGVYEMPCQVKITGATLKPHAHRIAAQMHLAKYQRTFTSATPGTPGTTLYKHGVACVWGHQLLLDGFV